MMAVAPLADLRDWGGPELHVLPEVDLTQVSWLAQAPTASASTTVEEAPFPVADTFLLASKPGANHTIYLDFNGHTTTGTIWNSTFNGGAAINTPAYDFDSNLASFGSLELERIQYIWQRVAEDFLPFNVNVTTQEPPVSDLIKSGTSDTRWGVRMAIGGSSSDWYKASAGGVAYVGSFNWNTDSPSFVFEAQLGNGDEKYTAEAISHEAGHTLGLNHDGRTSPAEEYYQGQGSWAPILGVGYYKTITQWSRGEYANPSNTQDDLTVIATNNGFSYRADDFGGTIATAGALSLSGTSVVATGIIERNTDQDYFSFATGGGAISLAINPSARGPNLDIQADLLNASGVVIVSSNPVGALNASIATTLAAGTYYLRIDGVGEGSPTSTGYSDYGSLGAYTVSGTLALPSAQFSVNDVSVNEAAGTASFTVSLNTAAASTATINVGTANGTAISGSDYSSTSTLLTFAPGQTSQQITVPITNDTAVEALETFQVNLSSATGATILDSQGIGSILDNDTALPTFSVNNVTISEAAGTATFTVSLSAASTGTATVNVGTANGTAISGSDYSSASTLLTFAPGQTSQQITIPIMNDTAVEALETFQVNLSSATGATILDSQGIGTITDNDASLTPTLSVSNASVTETNPRGNGTQRTTSLLFNVTLSVAATQTITVKYATANGTANTADYIATSGTLTFAPGETLKRVEVKVIGDNAVEASETVLLNLSSAVNATIFDSQGVGTILDNDISPAAKNTPGVSAATVSNLDAFWRSAAEHDLESLVARETANDAAAALLAWIKKNS